LVFVKIILNGNFYIEYVLNEQLTDKPEIWAQITVPNEFKPMGKYNIGFTAGLKLH
jgi:hypothetical protein